MPVATLELTEANAAEILTRFHQFHDALVLCVSYRTTNSGRLLTIELLAWELGQDLKQTVIIEASNPSELRIQECRTCVTVLSQGMVFRKIHEDYYLALSPYSEEMDSRDDFRQSDFYFAAPRIWLRT